MNAVKREVQALLKKLPDEGLIGGDEAVQNESSSKPGFSLMSSKKLCCDMMDSVANPIGVMSKTNPNIIVIAGPNGAGKTTTAPALLRDSLKVDEFVNADIIAVGLSGFQPEKAAIQAGRVMLTRLQKLAAEKADFAFETSLASRNFASWISSLKQDSGYRFRLVFLWLSSADLAVL